MHTNDITLPENSPTELLADKHAGFLMGYGTDHNQYAYKMTDYLRISGAYWAVTSLQMLKRERDINSKDIIRIIVEDCYDKETGGFRPWGRLDPHMLFTLSSLQILATLDALDQIRDKTESIAKYVADLQQPDGSFAGDQWGEIDNRFSFCALAILTLLGVKPDEYIRLNDAVSFVSKCQNFDGGFGLKPFAESHAGNIFCCLGFLSLADRLDVIKDVDQLGWWLCERQLTQSGGLNGRPEKLPDVCYSWWVLSSLTILKRAHWIDKKRLVEFILASQDEETGGFSDRPGNGSDPFHTLFGLAGLSLTGMYTDNLEPVNPVLCMCQKVLDKLNIRTPLVHC